MDKLIIFLFVVKEKFCFAIVAKFYVEIEKKLEKQIKKM